ncbi:MULTISPECIES: response regulator [Dethiosulfovibrio]|uniref:Response regulator transcription factor n=2 Tax=Dethiosulfovibrio TaxID=47054 RepID=A0ABS9EKL2_9BACT|nr:MULTISPECIES: response regulator transcription factor [Dethiosulfovibrio]MCF4113839.1 response regulator transcription factor [Dethiosulfovibrio russensis]MCF4141748.1 response regulator transcription factor [Dethiosulfovibrio marinus]MCF4143835.1 response regulator transcription factor [Dethiosulfovibrio acidaminovorans]
MMVADDHQIVRKGLVMLLEAEKNIDIVAEVSDGRAAVDIAEELRPHVAVMDIVMPGMGGIEATRRLRKLGVAVVALSMHSDRHFVVEMFRAGARAFLLKDCATDELVGAIRAVVEGEAYLGPSIERGLGMDLASLDYLIAEEDQRTELTPREWEILQLVAEGRSTREIASSLNLSAKTVENHRQSVMNKLDLHNVADLTKYAIRCGLTDTELL